MYALAPDPWTIFWGGGLGNGMGAEPYQRHRDTEDWVWKTDGEPAKYKFHRRRKGTDDSSVALLLSLSGSTHLSDLPVEIDKRFFIYEITLAKGTPRPGFLRTREDLARFKDAYEAARSSIPRAHAGLT